MCKKMRTDMSRGRRCCILKLVVAQSPLCLRPWQARDIRSRGQVVVKDWHQAISYRTFLARLVLEVCDLPIAWPRLGASWWAYNTFLATMAKMYATWQVADSHLSCGSKSETLPSWSTGCKPAHIEAKKGTGRRVTLAHDLRSHTNRSAKRG